MSQSIEYRTAVEVIENGERRIDEYMGVNLRVRFYQGHLEVIREGFGSPPDVLGVYLKADSVRILRCGTVAVETP